MNAYTERALALAAAGYTPIPLKGKIPVVKDWQKLHDLTPAEILAWDQSNLWQNVGLVCGAASRNTVVIDFDGLAGYNLFAETFPELTKTLTVATGSGNGKHCYYRVDLLPDSGGAMAIELPNDQKVNIEWKSDGKQVVVPPSVHPDTGKVYEKCLDLPILHVPDLTKVISWARALAPQPWEPPKQYAQAGELNRKLIDAIAAHFHSQPHKQHGEWLNCSCPNAAAHKHGDKNFSFGFNERDGGANCYSCGGMSLKDLCGYIGLNPADYGGFYEHAPIIQLATPTAVPGAPPTQPTDALPVVKRSSQLTDYMDRLTNYDRVQTCLPIPFPLAVLHEFKGMAEISKPGKLIGILGVSGGGKTSLLETMVDGWLAYHIPCLVWSPEWDADEFVERAVQRYGGPTMDEVYLHEVFISEVKRGIKAGVGVKMPQSRIDEAAKAIRMLREWDEEVGYLEFPFLTVGKLQASIDATLKAIDFTPRVLILDYIQLMHAMELNSDLTMYNLLLRVKAICAHYGLLGVIATQTTKESARNQQGGSYLDGLAARFVNDDAFNLLVTINPDRNEDGGFQPSAVLNVAKNSRGRRGKIRVAVDWAHMTFSDEKHADQTFEKEKAA